MESSSEVASLSFFANKYNNREQDERLTQVGYLKPFISSQR